MIELNRVLGVPPTTDVPPIPLLAFPPEGGQESLGPAKLARLQCQRVIAPAFITKEAKTGDLIALPVRAIHHRPVPAVGLPTGRIFCEVRRIELLAILLDANVLIFRRGVPGSDADAAGDGQRLF